MDEVLVAVIQLFKYLFKRSLMQNVSFYVFEKQCFPPEIMNSNRKLDS